MGYREVMELPLRTFWSLNRYVDRLRAEAELRQLQVGIAASSMAGSETSTKLSEHLSAEVGRPMIVHRKFDAAQFERLKEKIQQPG